jgi:hypothetical protein
VETAATEATTATVTAAAEPTAATSVAAAAATTAATTAATRQRGAWLGHCQNRCERGDGNTHTTSDADGLHADLLLHSPPKGRLSRRFGGSARRASSPGGEIAFNAGGSGAGPVVHPMLKGDAAQFGRGFEDGAEALGDAGSATLCPAQNDRQLRRAALLARAGIERGAPLAVRCRSWGIE